MKNTFSITKDDLNFNKESRPRAIRFDKEIVKLIQKEEGKNFTDKLHKVLVEYYYSEEERKKTINLLEKKIKEKKDELEELDKKILNINSMLDKLGYFFNTILSQDHWNFDYIKSDLIKHIDKLKI